MCVYVFQDLIFITAILFCVLTRIWKHLGLSFSNVTLSYKWYGLKINMEIQKNHDITETVSNVIRKWRFYGLILCCLTIPIIYFIISTSILQIFYTFLTSLLSKLFIVFKPLILQNTIQTSYVENVSYFPDYHSYLPILFIFILAFIITQIIHELGHILLCIYYKIKIISIDVILSFPLIFASINMESWKNYGKLLYISLGGIINNIFLCVFCILSLCSTSFLISPLYKYQNAGLVINSIHTDLSKTLNMYSKNVLLSYDNHVFKPKSRIPNYNNHIEFYSYIYKTKQKNQGRDHSPLHIGVCINKENIENYSTLKMLNTGIQYTFINSTTYDYKFIHFSVPFTSTYLHKCNHNKEHNHLKCNSNQICIYPNIQSYVLYSEIQLQNHSDASYILYSELSNLTLFNSLYTKMYVSNYQYRYTSQKGIRNTPRDIDSFLYYICLISFMYLILNLFPWKYSDGSQFISNILNICKPNWIPIFNKYIKICDLFAYSLLLYLLYIILVKK